MYYITLFITECAVGVCFIIRVYKADTNFYPHANPLFKKGNKSIHTSIVDRF